MRRVVMVISLTIIASTAMIAQVPIDLSKAREFQVVWKVSLAGSMFPITYVPSVCGVEGFNVVAGSTTYGRFTWRTNPRIDTTNIDRSLGIYPFLYDADGIPPLEYVNSRGHILRCTKGEQTPLPLQAIDTVAGCAGFPERSEDVDGDGYLDVLCDIGGGGYTAQVIRGGPNAGKGCQRILTIPKPPGRNKRNSTKAFWKSASGVWRLLRNERDSNALSPWMMLYEVRIGRSFGEWRIDFIKTDSLYGDGMSLSDEPFGEAAVVVDTAARRDWLLLQRRIRVGKTVFPLERFDATNGRFTPTGEQVTGVDFLGYWPIGYNMQTSKPVIGFHVNNMGQAMCFADDLQHPFALVRGNDRDVVATEGYVFINDQTGDGQPDLILSGGSPDGKVILMTIDTLFTKVQEHHDANGHVLPRLDGGVLSINLERAAVVTVDVTSLDGRTLTVFSPTERNAGPNRIDLEEPLHRLVPGVYLLRIQQGERFQVVRFQR